MERADGDDGRVDRIDLPAHDGLQVDDKLGGDDDRVDAVVRGGAVTALALDRDFHGVDVGHRQAFGEVDVPGLQQRVGMQGEAVVGFREAFVEAVREHRLGAGADFLGRLGDEHQRALPFVLHPGQHAGGSHPAGHVNVVAAGMHDADFAIGLVPDDHLAGVGNAGLFGDRQAVHVAPHQHGRPFAVLKDCHHAGDADFLGDLEAQFLQFTGDLGRRLFLLEGKLGVLVQVLVEVDQVGQLFLDMAVDDRDVILQAGVDFAGFPGVQPQGGKQQQAGKGSTDHEVTRGAGQRGKFHRRETRRPAARQAGPCRGDMPGCR